MNFPPTRLSVVERTRSADEETRRVAFALIIEAYWKPIYKYLRLKWNFDADAAADVTQEFFTHALQKDVLGRFDPARARFRTYLRLCVDGFAGNVKKAEGRLKRGGGSMTVPLDFETAEGEIVRHELAVPADVDELFYSEWVRALFQHAVDDLRRWADSTGRGVMFRVFERYDLADPAEDRPTYGALAGDLNLPVATVTNHLAAMRRQFRHHVLERLRDLTTSDDEFETEARRLLGSAGERGGR